LDFGDVMERVNADAYPIALMQIQMAEFWGQVFDDARATHGPVGGERRLFWVGHPKGAPQLKASLDDFSPRTAPEPKKGKYIKNAREAKSRVVMPKTATAAPVNIPNHARPAKINNRRQLANEMGYDPNK